MSLAPKIQKVSLDELPKFAANWSHVYVVQEASGPCKIGVGRNAAWRLVDLQVGNPRKLTLVAVYHTNNRIDALEIEEAVLVHFYQNKVRGEWLNVDPKSIINFIEGQDNGAD